MRLSDAMVLGSTLAGKAKNTFFSSTGDTCALGAAADALGIIDKTLNVHSDASRIADALITRFPVLKDFSLYCKITYLNNKTDMSREEIAQWIRESGNDCESVEFTDSEQIQKIPVREEMVNYENLRQ